MADVTTTTDALEFLRDNIEQAGLDDLRLLASLADGFASHFLDSPDIADFSNREIIDELDCRSLHSPMIDDIDEALAAIRGGDFQRATYLLERNASWAGKCSASAAWTNAGRPECGRLL